jgi:hypothetical protein
MDATVLLCDFAEAVNGKLYVMGGGWNLLFAPDQPANMSLAVVLAVDWNETNQRKRLTVELLDANGDPFEVGGNAVVLNSEFEVGRPPGIKPGTSLNTPLAFRFDGLVLPAGGYEFKVSIGGKVVASRPFTVTLPPGMPGLPGGPPLPR